MTNTGAGTDTVCARRVARTDASIEPVANPDYEPRKHTRSNAIPLRRPGPPFKLADVILCTPENERRQLALVTEHGSDTANLQAPFAKWSED